MEKLIAELTEISAAPGELALALLLATGRSPEMLAADLPVLLRDPPASDFARALAGLRSGAPSGAVVASLFDLLTAEFPALGALLKEVYDVYGAR